MEPLAGRPTLRPAAVSDDPFLFRVYAATRADEVAGWSWPAAQREAFLRQQCDAQRRSYRLQFPDARWCVVLDGAVPVGRLVVDRAAAEIHLIDVALLPEHRGQGLGTALIRDLQAEAERTRRNLRLQVEASNRALGLYKRLGFVCVGEVGIHRDMAWAACGGDGVGAAPVERAPASSQHGAPHDLQDSPPPNDPSGFPSFRRLVLADTGLQDALRSDSTDPGRFVAWVVRLGREHGFAFSAEDVQAAMRDARRAWLERWVR